MKNLITIYFLLNSFFSFAQERYFVSEYEYYELLDSVNFFYGYTGFCGSAPKGKGTYRKTEKNQIKFTFRKTPAPQDLKITYPQNKSENSAKIKIDFIIYEDSINNPLLGANIFYEKHGIKSGTSTDFDGKASLTIDTTLFNDTIYIQYIGVPKVKLFVLTQSQLIQMTLITEYLFEVFDEKRTFRINHRKKKLYYLKEE